MAANWQRMVPWLFLPLLGLTVALLLLVQLPEEEYQPVQSLTVFSHVPLFWALYSLWLLLLLVLLWQGRSPWGAAVLVGLFALVHLGVFVIATAYGAGEDWQWSVDPVQIQRTGQLEFVRYHDFPALAIVRAFLSAITGVEVFSLRTPLLLIWLVILSQLLFIGYLRLLKGVPLAALAVLLALQSNIMLARFYLHPMYMGVMLVVALLGFLMGREQPPNPRERLVLILFMAGLTVTHFVASMVGLFIIVGYYLEQRWRRRPEVVSQGMVTLGLTLVSAWAIFWTLQTFPNLVALLPEVEDRLRQGVAFYYVSRVTTANTEGLPSWVTGVQAFWWLAVYLGGGLLALRSLVPRYRLSAPVPSYAGAYVVLAGGVIVGTVVSTGGYDFYRFVVFGSFLAAPLVVYFLLAGQRSVVLPIAVSALFLALSFPTMLAHNTAIAVHATQPREVAVAQFLSKAVAGREEVTRLYGARNPIEYYSPQWIPNVVSFPKQGADIIDSEELRALWASYVNNFLQEQDQGKEAVFIFDYQSVVFWRHLFGLPEDDPLWSRVRHDLSQADLFYDAGPVQIYRSVPSPARAASRR